jgi:hypothetical protein
LVKRRNSYARDTGWEHMDATRSVGNTLMAVSGCKVLCSHLQPPEFVGRNGDNAK